MRTFSVRVAALIFAAFAPTAVSAALKPFTGPAGWDHTVAATATPALPRSQEAWKKSDGEQLIYLADAGLAFDDMVTQVKKNVADNNMKPSLAKDRTCAGQRAYEIELPIGASIIHQIIVDQAPGVTKLTYLRPQGSAPSPVVVSALEAYCGS
jgi:hypothetical protein